MPEFIQAVMSVALVLFAGAGFVATLGFLVTMVIIKNGGQLNIGYEEDPIIENNENENNNEE